MSTTVATRQPHGRRALTPMQLLLHFAMLLCALSFLMPLFLVVSASFTSEKAISSNGYSLFPSKFSVAAYRYVISDPSQLIQSYGVSILVTFVGTVLSVLVMALLGYVLSRRNFKARRALSFYVLFTMLFGGGLVPSYILMTKYLHLQNTIWALILPNLVIPWNVLLLRTFFSQLPEGVLDAARIDGAGEWRTFFRIALPMATPAIATIGMFTMLMYWNDWWLGLLYIDNPALSPVQLWLYHILSSIDSVSQNPIFASGGAVPVQSVRMAVAVLAIGPIVAAFVFFQKYFVRGITLGGIRE
ncbi:carbohydrate ABC transporter permease [Rugosimonospora africana]|uniref:Sugar ABC transporter permease n=1 Tax=Rugosimonospora africana TaxID=556532 RepID=A0A8J3VV29_9ACTN|nr:carbohydrate ABC transporter permease [Rugosimonospora africana]GIH19376.1 sugar ABC transporter permease [Rugosimonospora africana]